MSDVPGQGGAVTSDASRSRSITQRGWAEWLQRNAPILAPIIALVLVSAIFTLLAPVTFPSPANIRNILSQTSMLAFLAIGVTFVLLVGEIDLSVANVAVLSGMLSALMFVGQPIKLPPFGEFVIGQGDQLVCIVTALGLCTLLGLTSGVLIARLGVPSFIASLGVMLVADGLSFFWSQGTRVYDLMPIASAAGASNWGPLPAIVGSALTALLIAHIVLSRTRFGRYVYMTGSNRAGAELAGISTRRVLIQVFVVSALLAAISGIINVGRMGAAEARTGSELLLPAIAAVVLGGTSVFGGIGGIPNTIVGLLLYSVLNNGLDQMQMDIYLKPFARGAFLLIAIVFNIAALRLAAKSRSRATDSS